MERNWQVYNKNKYAGVAVLNTAAAMPFLSIHKELHDRVKVGDRYDLLFDAAALCIGIRPNPNGLTALPQNRMVAFTAVGFIRRFNLNGLYIAREFKLEGDIIVLQMELVDPNGNDGRVSLNGVPKAVEQPDYSKYQARLQPPTSL